MAMVLLYCLAPGLRHRINACLLSRVALSIRVFPSQFMLTTGCMYAILDDVIPCPSKDRFANSFDKTALTFKDGDKLHVSKQYDNASGWAV